MHVRMKSWKGFHIKTVARLIGYLKPEYMPDISKARTELHLDVTISLAEPIQRTLGVHQQLGPL